MAPEQARDTRQASMASDVFSLGATLAFAATGHPPYQGETVMDVLVRLATEPPDLSGLPAELTSIVTSCLERSPRQRPTSAALLDQLGPFVAAPAGPGSAHAYLPAPAMAMISGYQHGPRQVVRAASGGPGNGAHGGIGEGTSDDTDGGTGDGGGDEATFGSQTALSAPPSADRRPLWRSGKREGRSGGNVVTALPRPAGHRRRTTGRSGGARPPHRRAAGRRDPRGYPAGRRDQARHDRRTPGPATWATSVGVPRRSQRLTADRDAPAHR
jgi:hypothetical protein